MRTNTITGAGPSVVRKFLLTENGTFTIPPGMAVLHSEVVVDGGGTEVLEVWAAIPMAVPEQAHETSQTFNNAPPSPKTIYTNTVIYDDELEGYNPKSTEDDDEYYY